ncbi:MAG: hypothetical protein QGH60_24115 [Phycisphaerae bacterium]|nr:hypothetical protein [Phycisphaerae bacterium]
MTTLDIGFTGLADKVIELVGTKAASDQELVSARHRDVAAGWSSVIDQLLDWLRNPQELADEDFLPPSRDLIKMVCAIAAASRDAQLSSPLRVVPDGDGGISFERRSGLRFETINFHDNGSVEWLLFEDCKLVHRLPLG